MGVSQADISKFKHGHYSHFTSERLFKCLNNLDYNIDILTTKTKADEGHIRATTPY